MTFFNRAFAGLHGDALLRAVLVDGPDPVLVVDAAHAIRGLNEAAEELFGWPAAEVVGRHHQLLWADSADGSAGSPLAPVEGANLGEDRRCRRSSGEIFVGNLRTTPIRDEGGRTLGSVLIVLDVTDQRRLTGALAQLHTVTSSRDLRYQDKVERILEIGAFAFGLPHGLVSRVDGDLLTICHVVGGSATFAPGHQCQATRSYGGATLADNLPAAFHDLPAADPRAHSLGGDLAVRSYIGAPLNVDGERFGVIAFLSDEPRPRAFTEQEVEFVHLLGDWIGNEIARERDLQALRTAHDRLQSLASTDELTGVGNRRHFMELAKHDWERMRRTGRPLSLLVMDLDHFKGINDGHGHAVGDELLTAIACACRHSLRSADVFGRIGGEEFAVLLPEAGPERAREVAERLREVVAEARTASGDDGIAATASIGAATARESDRNLADLMSRADAALYRAKDLGRDRVVAAESMAAPADRATASTT